jgi:hypothetical protein
MAVPLRMERNQAHEMKDERARASREPTVSAAHLAAAITTAASMDIREKERVCDRIYAAQPNLLRAGLTNLRNETSKYPILVAINLVNCIATARRMTP